jgi:hypothetical protein
LPVLQLRIETCYRCREPETPVPLVLNRGKPAHVLSLWSL